jgi:hypothetical protein
VDPGARAGLLAQVRAHCARQPAAVLFDEPTQALFDVPSGKALALPAAELQSVATQQDALNASPYLRLALGDGRELALTRAGIAFAPRFGNTGPLPELPAAVCFADYAKLQGQLRHELYGHPDREPTRDTAKLLLLCIAILDGARAAGFEVGREEAQLEALLRELEKRAPPKQ